MQTTDRQQVFISYARGDGKAYAERLYDELARGGFKPWRDERNLDPYQDFSGELELAVEQSDYVVVCVTSEVRQRKDSFVRREVLYAQQCFEESGEVKPKIIPLVFPDGIPVPIIMQHLTYIRCFIGKQPRTLDFELGLQQLWGRLGVASGVLTPPAAETSPPTPLQQRGEVEDSLAELKTSPPTPLRQRGEIEDSLAELKTSPPAPLQQRGEVEDSLAELKTSPPAPLQQRGEVEDSLLVDDVELELAPIALPLEPYKEHLSALYRSIVDYLGQTIFSLITLSSTATPDAVDKRSVLPMRFADANADHIFTNIADAFEGYGESLLLLGDPGAGKTTTMLAFGREMVARRLENPDLRVPVVLRIPEWSRETQPGLDEWIAEKTSLTADRVNQLRREGGLLLLLDGLDELGDSYNITEKDLLGRERVKENFDPRLRFMQMLERDLGSNAVLITCRIKDYEDIGAKIALKGAVTLRPLDDNQLADYLHDQPDLLDAVRGDAGLREMAGTPLLLSLLRFAYSGMGETERQQLRDLSHSPAELREKIFESYVQHRFEHEQRRANVPLEFDLPTAYQMLGQLAVYLVGATDIKESDLYRAIYGAPDSKKPQKSPTDEQAAFVRQMRQMHLLVGEGTHLRFIHLLLRDYFAISMLLNSEPRAERDIKDLFISAGEKLGDYRLRPVVRKWMNILVSDPIINISSVYRLTQLLARLGDRESVLHYAADFLADDRKKWSTNEREYAWGYIFGAIAIAGGFGCLGVCVVGLTLQNAITLLQGGGLNLAPTPIVMAVAIVVGLGVGVASSYYDKTEPNTIRVGAARALGEIGGDDALMILRQYANDKNRVVQRVVKKAIQQIEAAQKVKPPTP